MKYSYKAGSISDYLENWRSVSNNNSYILDIVKNGYKLELCSEPESLYGKTPYQKFSSVEFELIGQEIETLLTHGVIEKVESLKNQVLSPIFLVDNKDQSKRMILNLKELNKYIIYHHFKMEGIANVRDLITKDCFLASIDLKKAYYAVQIHPSHRRYLRFNFNQVVYQYTCLPNGLSSGPRIFTKIMGVVFSHLRSLNLTSVVYLDDTLLISPTESDCKQNVHHTLEILQSLGLHINWKKSVLNPTKLIDFLGFCFNTERMKFCLTEKRSLDLQQAVCEAIQNRHMTIRQLASVLGKIVAALPVFKYGKLHYRDLELFKIESLRKNNGHFDRKCYLPEMVLRDLVFWKDHNPKYGGEDIEQPFPGIVIFTDASQSMWGAVCGDQNVGEPWSTTELAKTNRNINALEIMAVHNSIKKLTSILKDKTVLVRSDNVTAVQYINNMGGHGSQICNSLTKELLIDAKTNGISLRAAHIPGEQNSQADFMSRLNDAKNTEWSLSRVTFDIIKAEFGSPDIDLFASSKNKKCPEYISWKKDSEAVAIDAFSVEWSTFKRPYLFSPFSLLSRVTKKLQWTTVGTIIVYPDWSHQTWYPALQRMLVRKIKLPTHPFNKVHPLGESLKLMCGITHPSY